MPIFEITSPDGKKFRVTAPEGATREEALAKVKAQYAAPKEQVAPETFDPTEGMTGLQKFGAGYGKALPDLARGGEQLARRFADTSPLYGMMLPGNKERMAELEQEQALVKERDAPLMNTGAGMAGNVLGNAVDTAPMMMIPGMQGYKGAAASGAAFGAMQPTAPDDSRAMNAAVGAGAGMAGQALGNTLGRAIRPVASQLSPEEQILANAAKSEGIPLTAGQQTGSRPLKVIESVMEDLPLTSGPQLATREAQQRAFTAAALRRAGMEGSTAGPGAMAAQKGALGKELGAIAERNTLDFNKGLSDKLAAITDDAAKHLDTDAAAKVAQRVDKILQQVDESGKMLGSNYQGWREPLRKASKAASEEASYYGKIRGAMDAAFKEGIEGADAQAFGDTSRKYANLKTIIDAMGGNSESVLKEQIAPNQLAMALSRSIGKEGKALGRGELNQLTKVGRAFVSDKYPQSGTAPRLLAQSLLTGGGAGLGGLASMAGGGDIGTGMMAGGALTAGGLGAPRVIQALMNSPAGQAYLTKGIAQLSPAMREALAKTLRTGALATMPALSQ